MPESILLGVALALAAVVVLAPLRDARAPTTAGDEREAAAVRHRAALEAMRDVEADRRAGSLDHAAYAEQMAEAEAVAAATRAALDHAPREAPGPLGRPGGPRAALVAAAAIAVLLVGGSLVESTGIANATVVNEPLAAAQAAESARQATIADLLGRLDTDPRDTAVLSDLADAYLAGSTRDDLVRAAVALQLIVDLEPDRADAYERLMTAYLRAGDYGNARAVHDSYVALDTADPIEAAFFDGLIALRGENDPARARAAFDRFLRLAPDDPRAAMIRGLRADGGS